MLHDTINQLIVNTISAYQRQYNKRYCFPSQETILESLKLYHKIVICRRTLNYRLRKLEEAQIIYRIRRHHKDINGMLILKSTAYYLGVKFKAFMWKIKRFAFKIQQWCGVQEVAQHYKKSKYLLFKDSAKGGQVVNNLSFIT